MNWDMLIAFISIGVLFFASGYYRWKKLAEITEESRRNDSWDPEDFRRASLVLPYFPSSRHYPAREKEGEKHVGLHS